jgi:hypothetical protein
MKLTVTLLSLALVILLVHTFQRYPYAFGYEYVPAKDFKSVVRLSAQSEAKVGEWISITAERHNGPWTLQRKKPTEGPRVFFDSTPPVQEAEVSASLGWDTDPPGHARFNLPLPGESCNTPRKVMFNAAGVYKIRGYSAFPARVFSNTITINVSAPVPR